MPSKRSHDYLDGSSGDSPVPVTDGTPRKYVRAILPGGDAMGTGLTGEENIRKKQRLEGYHRDICILNQSFAQYCDGELHKYEANVESKTTSKVLPPGNYVEEALQYIERAAAIKAKYFPPTGNLLTFGTNEFGQIAQSENVEGRYRPAIVNTARNIGVIQVECGGLHNVLVTDKGRVSSWGCNDEGSLGDLGTVTAYSPVDVRGFVPSSKEQMGTSAAHRLGVTPAKYTWNDLKQANNGTPFSDPTVAFDSKYEERIVAVSAGDCQCLALSEHGRVYMFGAYKDKEGQCWGDCPPSDDPRRYPDYVPDLELDPEERPADPNTFTPPAGKRDWPVHVWQLGGKAIQISCGFSFNAAVVNINKNNTVKQVCVTWGLGESGELARDVELQIKKPGDTFDHLSKIEYSLAIAKDPYMKFKVDVVGRDYMTPQLALWADGNDDRIVEKVACGGYHLLVIAKDTDNGRSRLYSSGLNNYGQCGHNDGINKDGQVVVNNRERLTKIESLKNIEITQVAAGEHFTLALDITGKKLYGFGRSCSGQLGYTTECPDAGSFSADPIPIYLEYDANGNPKENPVITQISCGGIHSFAHTENGDCYSWGYGVNGQLGVGKDKLDGDEDYLLRPMKIPVTFGVNVTRLVEGKCPVKPSIRMVSGGGQHSAMIVSLEEVAVLPEVDTGALELAEKKKEKLKAKARKATDQADGQENGSKRLKV